MDAILKRRSIRKYTSAKISDEIIESLLGAAMAAPSAGNEQPWDFIVLRDRETMKKISKIHPYASMLLSADVAIVVCGDESRELYKGFWVQDCSACTENILIAAEDMGLGAVWLGIYPVEDRVNGVKEFLNLPEDVYPLSIIPIGYPDEEKDHCNRFDKSRVHYNKW